MLSNQFGISGLSENWIALDELYGAVSYFSSAVLVVWKKVAMRSRCEAPETFVDKENFIQISIAMRVSR